MAQLFFKYGAMNSSKSASLLMTKHNYEEQGKNVLLFTSALDNRDGVGNVSSRVGISQPAIAINKDSDIQNIVKEHESYPYITCDCILIDEAQFLTKQQVKQLAYIVDSLEIPVIAYGLKNDFQNSLFEGSEALLIYADKIEEIKTICWYCHKKGTMNLRLNDGKPVYSGEQVQIGGNESYVPVCRKHYNEPNIVGEYRNRDKSQDELSRMFRDLRVGEGKTIGGYTGYHNTNGFLEIYKGNRTTEWEPAPVDFEA